MAKGDEIMKEFLEKLRGQKETRIKEIRESINNAKTVDEVRSSRVQLDIATEELSEINEALSRLGDEVVESRKVDTKSIYTNKTTPKILSIGDHFINEVKDRISNFRGVRGASISASEYEIRASNTDTITTGGPDGWAEPLLNVTDPTIIPEFRRPTITDLFGSGTMTGTSITYFVEGVVVGDFETVAEGGSKPQIYITDPTPVTDSLKKIAGFIKLSDEMFEDLPFVVSEINGRLLYMLSLAKERQIITGDGLGTNVLGLLNRIGLQEITSLNPEENADMLYRAISGVNKVTGFYADGIVINPSDYEELRLSKDANGQYFGGGFFLGAYGITGVGGFAWEPPIWGVRTVVSPAVDPGTAIVGAFTIGGTVYGKGGIRVEATNSHADDFTNNLVTMRAEERVGLAVRYPAAFVKVTLAIAG